MQVHFSLPSRSIMEACALTIGTFDGVHAGHQFLVEKLVARARALGVPAVALTFVDMPICHFRSDICPQLLTICDEKVAAFETTELDHLFIVPFGAEMAGTSAREFMEYWHQIHGLRHLLVGPDFALGRNREGDIPALLKLGQEMGFEVEPLAEKLLEAGEAISSTRIRGMVEEGDVQGAESCLNRPYHLAGKVVGGQQLGRTIGFPTINLEADARKCLPGNGVYAVRVLLDGAGDWLPAAMNIGMRPTVAGTTLAVEFHVLGRVISNAPHNVDVHFVQRLRDEQKFDGLEGLVTQLRLDMQKAAEILQ